MTHARPEQLAGAPGHDRDDRGTDAIESALHPGELAESDVERGQGQHHEERRSDERQSRHRRAQKPPPRPAEIYGELRRQRPGRELRERESLLVLLDGHPPAVHYQVALHGGSQRDGAAEPEGAESQEVRGEPAQGDCIAHSPLVVIRCTHA